MSSNLTKYPGRDFLLKVRMPSGNFETLGGCRSNSQTNSNESIDVSNKSDGVWRQLIPGGQKAMSLSASGVVTNDAVFVYARDQLRDDLPIEVMTCYGDGRIEYAPVLGTSSEITGENNSSQDFSLSLESADAVVPLAIDVLPDYRLDFAGEQSLAPVFGEGEVTFLRASSGTFTDFDGIIKTAAIDRPRFEHDADGRCLGLLVEEQRTNILLQSGNQNSSPWVLASATAEPNQLAPDGSLSATRITSTAGGGRVTQPFVVASTGRVTYSGFVKPVVGTQILLLIRNDTTAVSYSATINNDGTVAATTNVDAVVTVRSDGYLRIAITPTVDFTASDNATAYFYAGNASDIGQSTDVWGAQVESGAAATSYIPTTDAQVTRARDLVSAVVPSAPGTDHTLFVDAKTNGDPKNLNLATIHDVAEENVLSIARVNNAASVFRRAANVSFGSFTQVIGPELQTRIAASVSASTSAVSANGEGAAFGAAAAVAGPLTELRIGAFTGVTGGYLGTIGAIDIYDQELAPADLQALTE